MFSIFTILINFYVLLFIVTQIHSIWVVISPYLLIFILIINSLLLLRGIDSLKFFQFFAFSGINTLTTVLIFLVIK